MALTLATAVDGILKQFTDAWTAGAGAITGGAVPKIVYESIEKDLKPEERDTSVPWARVAIRHSDSSKATLQGADGTGRFRRLGIAYVQIFVPFKSGADWTLAQSLAMLAQTAYEGKRAGEVVFTKATLKERSPDGPWCRWDCIVEFRWDQIR